MTADEVGISPALRVLIVLGLIAVIAAFVPPALAASGTDEPAAPEAKPAPAPQKARPARTAKPNEAAPAAKQPASPASLRFTDDDLKAYHKPVVDDEPVGDPEALVPLPMRPATAGQGAQAGPVPRARSVPQAVGQAPKAGAKSPAVAGAAPAGAPGAAPPKGKVQTSGAVTFATAPAVRRPPQRRKPAAPPDPLAPFKQREAQEQHRAGQIQGLRDRIGGLEERLAYLRQKRIAIVDPLNLMPRSQSEEDRQADATLKPRDLLQQVETEIAATEAELETVRTTLADIELRFGSEAATR